MARQMRLHRPPTDHLDRNTGRFVALRWCSICFLDSSQMESIYRRQISPLFWVRAMGAYGSGWKVVWPLGHRHLTTYLIEPTRINSIIEDRNGTVWFVRTRLSEASQGGLARSSNRIAVLWQGRWNVGSDGAASLVEDSLGSLWIAVIQRLSAGNQFIRHVLANGIKVKTRDRRREEPRCQSDGSIWVGIDWWAGLGLQQIVQGQRKLLPFPN